jgi:outer membrane protein TolC
MDHRKSPLYALVYILSISLFLPLSMAQDLAKEPSPKIDEYLSQGKELYRQDKLKEAIETWQKVLEIEPDNSQAQRYIERTQERLQELEETQSSAKEEALIKKAQEEKEETRPPLKATIEIQPFTAKGPELIPEKGKPVRMLNLKQAVQVAVDNSMSLTTARREIKLSKQKVKDAWRGLFPAASVKWEEIDGTTTGEDFKGREFYLELQQPLYQGGRLTNTLRQAQINMQVARHNYQKIKNDLVFEVEQAYHILASTKKTYRELTELLAVAHSDYKMGEKEFELNLEREIDFLNIKNLYQETEYKVLSNQKDLTLAYLTLYQTLNVDPQTETIDIPETPDPKILEIDLEQCTKLAIENRSDLTIKELLYKFNKYGLQIALSQNRLKIDLTASGGYKDEVFITEDLQLKPEWYIGIKGSIPIWLNTFEYSFIDQDKVPSAGQTTSTQFRSSTATLRLFDNTGYTSITEAKVNLDKAKDELEKLEKSVVFETKQDFYEYQKAVYQLSNSATKLKLSEVELAIVETQRDLNLAATNDVLRTRIKLWEAKTGYHQATAGYFTSIAKLNKTIGLCDYFQPMGEETTSTAYPIPPPDLNIALSQTNISPRTVSTSLDLKNQQFRHMDNKSIEPSPVGTKKQEEITKSAEPIKEEGKSSAEKQNLEKEKKAINIEEQKRKDEEKKLSEQKKLEDKKKQEEQKQLETLKREEEKKQAQLKKQGEENNKKATKEFEISKKKEEEAKKLEEQKKREEEKKQEQAKKEEEKQKAIKEKEAKKIEEQKKNEAEKQLKEQQKAEEKRKQKEQKQLEKNKKEEERKQREAEKQRQEQEKQNKKLEEQKRKDEEKKLSEQKKLEDKKKQEEQKQLETLKREEEKKQPSKPVQPENIKEEIQKAKQEILADLEKEKKIRQEIASQKSDIQKTETAKPDEYAAAEALANDIAKIKDEKQKLIELGNKEKLLQLQKEEEKKKKEYDKKIDAQIKKDEKIKEQKTIALEREKRKEEERIFKLRKEEERKLAELKKQEEKKIAEERKVKEKQQKEDAEKAKKAKQEQEAKPKLEEKKKTEETKKREAQKTPDQSEINKMPQPQPAQTQPEQKASEYQTAVEAAKQKLSQLEAEKALLLTNLKSQQDTYQNEVNKSVEKGKKYYGSKDYASAIKEWSKALALDPSNKEAKDGIKSAEDALRKSYSQNK